jgi:hypothetical protein
MPTLGSPRRGFLFPLPLYKRRKPGKSSIKEDYHLYTIKLVLRFVLSVYKIKLTNDTAIP